jgi:hypothetical protein
VTDRCRSSLAVKATFARLVVFLARQTTSCPGDDQWSYVFSGSLHHRPDGDDFPYVVTCCMPPYADTFTLREGPQDTGRSGS